MEEYSSLTSQESIPGNINALYEAIGKASAAFPALPRTAKGMISNTRSFQYAPYHKVVECIKPSLTSNGLGFIQPIHTEVDGYVSITLVVFGHGGTIASTLKFKQDTDPKVFGANCTYHKRYQLTSFFGLEGDPDADDFDNSVVETTAKISKTVPVESKPAAKPETKALEGSNEGQAKDTTAAAAVSETPKTSKVQQDTRSIGAKLTDAMKQLIWKMEDFDAFCKQYPEDFPGFISASKLSPDGKQKLYDMLVLHKSVAPF